MKFIKALAPVAAAAALAAVPMGASAALMVEITDGVSSVVISDNGVGDIDGFLGGVSYYGMFKTWEVAFAQGTSTTAPIEMHLTSMVAGNAGDGVLTIKLTQTDLQSASGVTTFLAGGSGWGAYGSSASWAAYVDDSNTAFGSATTVANSSGFNSLADSITAPLSGTYSATLVTTFDYTKVTVASPYRVQSSLDVGMKVPEPASLALVGLALLGIGAVRRRKA